MDFGVYIVAAVLAYFLGSLPTGFLAGKARGIDIRTVGSGNIGATNAFRILGTPAGILVLVVDGLKGYAGCAWITDFLLRYRSLDTAHVEYLRMVAGVAVVMGHNYTCWLKFKGGKGIATSAGVLAALVPVTMIVGTGVWIVVFAFSRYVSLASIAGAFVMPIVTWLNRGSVTMIVVISCMSLLAIYKHRTNIQRLIQGTESRVGTKKRGEAIP